MKNPYAVILTAVFLLITPSLFAAEIASPGTPVRKLQRGFLNIALSPIEISTEMARHKKEDHVLPAWVTSAGLGSVLAIGRILAGTYDILTSPLPIPKDYGPIINPEFPWQHFDEPPQS